MDRSAENFKTVYVAEQKPYKGWMSPPRGTRYWRKFGTTSVAPESRVKAIVCDRGTYFRLVKSWKVKHPGFAYEWVCKQLLTDDGHRMWGEETKAKSTDLVTIMERAIRIVDTGEFKKIWKKSQVSPTLKRMW